jgi:hypothetical protein
VSKQSWQSQFLDRFLGEDKLAMNGTETVFGSVDNVPGFLDGVGCAVDDQQKLVRF